jgi:hypothetical protein
MGVESIALRAAEPGGHVSKQDRKLVGVFLVILGIAALQHPNCRKGCKTWATHPLNHGLKAIL